MENGENEARDPSGFLSAIIGAPVTVKLNSGVVYKGLSQKKFDTILTLASRKRTTNYHLGELQSVDGYMNIALEQTKEYVDGELQHTFGDAFIRGNNGTHFSILENNEIFLTSVVMYISADS
jgi:U6 snRNA-associated Sm-like protein LSm6